MPYTDHQDWTPDDDDEEGATCLRCGESGLYWQETYDKAGNPKPVLYDSADDRPHRCVTSASPDEFPAA